MIFDPALLGVWRDAKEKRNYFAATRAESGNAYRVLQSDGSNTSPFTVRLLKLGDLRFIDLQPDEPPNVTGFYNAHLVKSHTFGKIELKGDKLTLNLLDPDWFKTDEAKGVSVKPIYLDDDWPLLTQSTQALQEFSRKYANTKAFEGTSEWVREAR